MIVTLYSKPGCHLCESAQAELGRLQRKYPHSIEVIDITSDAALSQRYGERIPVLEIEGREYGAPLSPHTIEEALRGAKR